MATVFLSSLLNPVPEVEQRAPGSFLMAMAKSHGAPAEAPGFLNNLSGGLDPNASTAEMQAFARRKARQMFGPGQWPELKELVNRESGWNPEAQNDSSTAYGLFQFLDGTWAGTGFEKTGDPRQQILAGLSYIKARYQNPLGAISHHDSEGWY